MRFKKNVRRKFETASSVLMLAGGGHEAGGGGEHGEGGRRWKGGGVDMAQKHTQIKTQHLNVVQSTILSC